MSRRNLIGLRRCSTIRATSPNHEGVEGTDRDVVWMITDPSAILVICASLMEVVLFFLLKEAHFYPCSLQVTSRCAIRGYITARGHTLIDRELYLPQDWLDDQARCREAAIP